LVRNFWLLDFFIGKTALELFNHSIGYLKILWSLELDHEFAVDGKAAGLELFCHFLELGKKLEYPFCLL